MKIVYVCVHMRARIPVQELFLSHHVEKYFKEDK